jgi:stage V sporulation protein AD
LKLLRAGFTRLCNYCQIKNFLIEIINLQILIKIFGGFFMEKNSEIKGKQSILFKNPPYIQNTACIVGKKEGEGPLKDLFDEVCEDPMFGMNTWEEAESNLQTKTVDKLLKKSNLVTEDIRYIFAGDLLGQLIGSTFGLIKYNVPFFGVYGACSTMGETMALASMAVNAGYADRTIAVASSHFASAEKQFRFPLAYGNQRPLSATWTVTGCGAVMIGKEPSPASDAPNVRIAGITTGKIVDYGVKDSMNMGACMAPAAADLVCANLKDLGACADYYDKIITGDLGSVGRDIIINLVKQQGYDISGRYMDCGLMVYDNEKQDTHSGGSGCGCSAVVLCSHILEKIKARVWKRVLFIPTGALVSPVSYNEGHSVPGIAHGIILERE